MTPEGQMKLDQLKAEHDRTRREIQRIEEAEAREKSRALVGKCFRYRNCYSMPQKPSDYWWLYLRVVSTTADGNCRAFSFQEDRDGQISIETRARAHTVFLDGAPGSYRPISRRQFDTAWRRLQTRIRAMS